MLPNTQALLTDLGERIKLARLRRNITSEQMIDRLGISLNTYRKIEFGDPSVAMGNYLAALQSLQLQSDLALVALEDKTGRLIQDSKLLRNPRRRAKSGGTAAPVSAPVPSAEPLTPRAMTSKQLLGLIKTGKS